VEKYLIATKAPDWIVNSLEMYMGRITVPATSEGNTLWIIL